MAANSFTPLPRPLEADAWASSLYERYRAPILRYCRGRLTSADEAEDAVQNTFLRAFCALRKGVRPDFEAAWLFKIAHNVCLSRRLGETRRLRIELRNGLDGIEERVASPERETPDELRCLGDALAEMPDNLRRVILLREWQGLSYAEIAETLGVSVSAVESSIFRARRYLAETLRPPVEPLIAA
jgi:RNA polymerase sigma factor (sigma-70 family)